ncbi:MAG TPA: HAMP domain-containing sensor histidine kinase [Polyangiales bacterium]|nr:HAMP domain-containing sensor histidine kinase [Polyangiales bacterium]
MTSAVTQAPGSSSPPRNPIARRLAVGFGLVAGVAVVMCGMLFTVIRDISGLVDGMRADERAIDQSHALATAVREQYAHQAHTIIEVTRSHLDHYQVWVEKVRQVVDALRPLVPASERSRLDRVVEHSRALDTMFRSAMVPAVERGDLKAVVTLHHEADRLSSAAAGEADAIARAVELRMAHAHTLATRDATAGLLGGGACIGLVLALSLSYTLRLRAAVLKPLAALAEAARRFGAGDYSTRIGERGEGEFRELARGFDRMVEEIAARERRMLQAERMAVIGQLAAGVAHEINNPIGIIRGYLKTMAPSSAPGVLQDEIRILDEEAAACQRIAEDLLEYARVTELRVEPTSMREFLLESIRRFEDARTTDGCRFVVNAQPSVMSVDPGRIRQVLFNLLRNAAHVSPRGSPIEVVGTRTSSGYEITVADRGPGVDAKDRASIFQPFFSRTSGGSGLGLAVCESIVRAHGGSIGVEDGPMGGAMFRLQLPEQEGQTS